MEPKKEYKKTGAQGSGYEAITNSYCLWVLILIDGETGHQLTAVIFKLRLQLGAGAKATTGNGR